MFPSLQKQIIFKKKHGKLVQKPFVLNQSFIINERSSKIYLT